jgi:hypothetical protein
MISAQPEPPFEELAQRLEDQAEALARAHAEQRLLALRNDPRRWRRAHLLWPLFAKG